MHVAIPWIENHSGIDITPCHDSEGNWAPTPDCGSIPLQPASTNGASWANGCSGGPVSGFSALCGDAFGSGEDPDPPSVAIIDPPSGQSYDIPDGETQAELTVSAQADDGDGFGVANVRLVINGQEFPGNSDSSAPYNWPLVFGAGGYIIEAIATDYVGNESAADVIAIGVDQAAPDLPETGDGDGDPTTGGDGDPTGGPDTGLGDTGDDAGFDQGDKADCACSSGEGERSGAVLALLGMFGLLGFRRASTSRSRR
jgi:MYXO-CTERM domain-containing protein